MKDETFGSGWFPQFDAASLISHPWALSPDDFKKTYEALLDDQLPMGLPAERASAAATFDWLSGFLGAGAAFAAIIPGGQAAAPFIGVASAGAWGVGKLSGLGDDAQLKSRMNALRANVPDLIQKYKLEAALRLKAVGQAPASPALTSSNTMVRLGL